MDRISGIVNLGLAVIKLIIKLIYKNDVVSVSDGVIGIVEKGNVLIADKLDQFEIRKGKRILESIADSISSNCRMIMEGSAISEERCDAIVQDIITVLQESEISDEFILSISAKPDALKREIEKKAENRTKLYDQNERDLCSRMFTDISMIIVDAYVESTKFGNIGTIRLIQRFDTIQDSIDRTLEKLQSVESAVMQRLPDIKQYEAVYRTNVISHYEHINLLGAKTLTRDETKYPLDIGYVSLELCEKDHTTPIDLQTAIRRYNSIWIFGEAGSGKTTLLQWLAVNCARSSPQLFGSEFDYLPILIELRRVNADEPSVKNSIQRIMNDEDISAPEGWIQSLLTRGRIMLLFDGVDEVKKEDRNNILSWIERIRRKYPKIKIVITSRPQIETDLINDYIELSILPMFPETIFRFIDYWHNAVLKEKLRVNEKDIEQCKEKLKMCLLQNEPIRRIASNPLLCAMICALHYNNGNILSTNKNELYEDCCKMLLSYRDAERGVALYSQIDLNYFEKKAILSRYAYWIMRNGMQESYLESFQKSIALSLKQLDYSKKDYSVDLICNYFIERSGLLQVVDCDQIEFIHRSFLEFLTASEIVHQDDWGYLLSRVDDPSWIETMVLTVSLASTKRAKKILDSILNREGPQYTIIAAVCASNIVSLNEQMRDAINQKVSSVLPPKNSISCTEIAKAGNIVTPFLVFNDTLSEADCLLNLKTLLLINTSQALGIAFTYLVPTVSERIIELLGAMLLFYPSDTIKLSGITSSIISYIHEQARTKDLIITEPFLSVLSQEEFQTIKTDIASIKHLTVFNYEDRLNPTVYSTFKSLKSISIIGKFKNLRVIDSIGHRLQKAEICDYSGKFDLYDLNKTKFSPESFKLHTCNIVYISGRDLEFLKMAKHVGFFLYNSESEVDIQRDNSLQEVERFDLFVVDYYPEILKRIREACPKAKITAYCIDNSVVSSLHYAVLDNDLGDGWISIKRFDFPFGGDQEFKDLF